MLLPGHLLLATVGTDSPTDLLDAFLGQCSTLIFLHVLKRVCLKSQKSYFKHDKELRKAEA